MEIKDKVSKNDSNVLGSDRIIYDGERADKVTRYKKGTPFSEIKPEHKKLFGIK